MFFHQKIDVKAIVGNAGLLLYVPGCMAFCSLPFCFFFHEYYAIIPFFITGVVNFLLGYIFYKVCFRSKIIHLWDAMLSAALGWILCAFAGSIPYLWIAHHLENIGLHTSATQVLKEPINAFFETFSGFTSTGLSMIKEPQKLPHLFQWWRAFTQWVGGVGLIVFVISFIEPYHTEYRLFYAETRSKETGKSLLASARMIWLIYMIYTLLFIGLFTLFQMPLWESICHTLSGISTGGFTISNNSFAHYSAMIKFLTILLMTCGAISFSIHHKVLFEKNFKILVKNIQNRVLFLLLIIGSVFLFLCTTPYFHWIDAFFQWVSALVTCGFSTKNLDVVDPIVKIFLLMGMIIGGASGSTVGGIKIRRLIYLGQAILLRLQSFTIQKEKLVLKETKKTGPTGVKLPESRKTERLYEASVLFVLWMFSIVFGWILLSLALPLHNGLNLLFDVVSAVSNVGLSSGVTGPELSLIPKLILIFLMWIGRLEIIPIVILFISLCLPFMKKHNRKK